MKIVFIVLIGFLSIKSVFCQDNKQDSIVNYIKNETVGGKLDFMKVLEKEGKAKTLILYNGVAYNPKDYSILLWGQAVNKLGIKKAKDAALLWEEINKRKLSKPELRALNDGFKAKIK
jgi:hypothetical protein